MRAQYLDLQEIRGTTRYSPLLPLCQKLWRSGSSPLPHRPPEPALCLPLVDWGAGGEFRAQLAQPAEGRSGAGSWSSSSRGLLPSSGLVLRLVALCQWWSERTSQPILPFLVAHPLGGHCRPSSEPSWRSPSSRPPRPTSSSTSCSSKGARSRYRACQSSCHIFTLHSEGSHPLVPGTQAVGVSDYLENATWQQKAGAQWETQPRGRGPTDPGSPHHPLAQWVPLAHLGVVQGPAP